MIDRREVLVPGEKTLALAAVAVLMALVIRHAWVTEDAFITLRTVDNLLHGYGLRWNVDERVQAYTHPLWMMLLAVPYGITSDAYLAALLLGLGFTLAAALMVIRLAPDGGNAVVALSLLAISTSFLDYSTSGLENPLIHFLIALFVWLYAVRQASSLHLALSAAALALSRPDTLLLTLVPIAHTCFLELRASGVLQVLKRLAIGFSPLVAWEAFSVFYYGFLVPNTAFAKLNTGIRAEELRRQGVAYLTNGIAWDPGLLLPIIMGLGVCVVRRDFRIRALALSSVLYVAYIVRVGGDFMQGRFLTVPVFLSACIVAVAPLGLGDAARVAAMLAPVVVFALQPAGRSTKWADVGVVDERVFYEENLALAQYSRDRGLPFHVWRDQGLRLAEIASAEPVQPSYNIGITGFYAGPKVHLVDQNALADPLLARLPARYDHRWRVGHYTRVIPNGYLETLRQGKCVMDDRSLCEYYEKLKEVVAGDLWSWSRFKSIAAMNLGYYGGRIDVDRYRYPSLERSPLRNLTLPLDTGAAWDHPNARKLTYDGIELLLDRPTAAKALSISFDGNDTYAVEFRLGTSVLGEVVSLSPDQVGMTSRRISVPPAAQKKGFDRLRIRPLRGDRQYSFGYVRINQ